MMAEVKPVLILRRIMGLPQIGKVDGREEFQFHMTFDPSIMRNSRSFAEALAVQILCVSAMLTRKRNEQEQLHAEIMEELNRVLGEGEISGFGPPGGVAGLDARP